MEQKILTDSDYKSLIFIPKEGAIDENNTDFLNNAAVKQLMQDNRFRKLLIPPTAIKKRIKELAREIIHDNPNSDRYHIIMVLTGAFMTASDLAREIFMQGGPEIIFHPMKLSTYASEIKQAGETTREVEIQLDCADLKGHDIIVVEDIIDQGFTLNELKKFLLGKKQVRSVKICTLLEKRLDNPTEEVKNIRRSLDINYVGFRIPDMWVAGYGIDSGDEFRHLPFVIAVNEDYYL